MKTKPVLNRPNMKLRSLIERFLLDYQSERTMVCAFSRGRTEELSELSEKECKEMEDHLRKCLVEIPSIDDISRKRIKKLCQDLGWVTEDGQACENTLNIYLLDQPAFKKKFMYLDSVDLSDLIDRLNFIRKEIPGPHTWIL